MPGRMQADLCAAEGERLAIADTGKLMLLAEAMAKDRQTGLLGKVIDMTGAGVIGVRMGDHRTGDRPPRVDMKVARRAVKPFVGWNDQRILHAQGCPLLA